MSFLLNTDIFSRNVLWNINHLIVQFGHAMSVHGKARGGYYKMAVIIAASVVEALVYKLLSDSQHLTMPSTNWECFSSYLLPVSYKSEDGFNVSICKRRKSQFVLKRYTDFKKMNEVGVALKLFSQRFFKKLERVRKLRNKIHIQGLEVLDGSYNKRDLECISSIMDELLIKLCIVRQQ